MNDPTFGHDDVRRVWRRDGTDYDQKNTVPTLKYDVENIMI